MISATPSSGAASSAMPSTPSGARRRAAEVADSLTWLRAELPDYWPQREALAAILRYLAALDVDHWREDAAAAPPRRRRRGERSCLIADAPSVPVA